MCALGTREGGRGLRRAVRWGAASECTHFLLGDEPPYYTSQRAPNQTGLWRTSISQWMATTTQSGWECALTGLVRRLVSPTLSPQNHTPQNRTLRLTWTAAKRMSAMERMFGLFSRWRPCAADGSVVSGDGSVGIYVWGCVAALGDVRRRRGAGMEVVVSRDEGPG